VVGCTLPGHMLQAGQLLAQKHNQADQLKEQEVHILIVTPKHFVAYYAPPRLWVPRYPPQAFPLLNLAINVKAMPS